MVLNIPPGIDSDGADLVAFVPTLADPSAPTLAELSASGAILFGCYLTGTFEPSADQDTQEDKRYCSQDTAETAGKTKWKIGDLEYIVDPQNPSSESNKAAMALVDGLSGYFVRRMGKDVASAPTFAANDYVEVFSGTLGPQVTMPGESGQKVRVKQNVTSVRRITKNYKLAA